MDDRQSEAEKLSIRCPGCSQRFTVGPELMGRMVECGTCEHRFRVSDEVVVRQKRFYPGERRDRGLDQFSRIPKGGSPSANFQTAQYVQDPVKVPVAGTSPLRLIFGMVGVSAVVLVLLLLAFGGKPGGMLDGAPQSKRLMLAGFTALLAWIFLLAANPAARIKATLGALLSSGLLLSFPFLFTEGEDPKSSDSGILVVEPPKTPRDQPDDADPTFSALKRELGYEQVQKEIERHKNSPELAGKSAAGIWLRGMEGYHRLQIRDYIIRNTGADPSSHIYPRTPDYLMVVSGVSQDLSELARLCERFGEVKRVIDELRVIEVAVDNESFKEGPLEKLTNRENPSFYEMNRRELESIDLERARHAVMRLGDAEPKLYRKDIVARMLQLMKEGDVRMQDQICRALAVWAEPDDGSVAVVRAALAKLSPTAGEVPESMVKFLAASGDQQAIPLVDALWVADHNRWEDVYGNFGPGIEDHVLGHFDEAKPSMKRSAARLLGKVGGTKSIPVLEAAREGADAELSVFIERAIAAIQGRS